MSQPKQIKKNDGGSEAWVALLSKCIASIETEDFPRSLICALKVLAEIDFSQAYAYYKNEKPLNLFHTFSPEKKTIYVDDYLKGPYLLDPFFKACMRKVNTGLYRLHDIAPDRFYQSEYYRSYYNQTGVVDEICYTFYLESGVAIVISLMRSGENSRFSAREFKLLNNVSPIIIRLAHHHWQGVAKKFDIKTTQGDQPGISSLIEDTANSMFSKRLTPRETQVVAQVLEGHSSDSIAKELGITVGTVRIHRRNVYAKLQISSQQELFSIFLKNITKKR